MIFYITLLYTLLMNPGLNEIKESADGLLFISESDHPLELITFTKPAGSISDYLKKVSNKKDDAAVETQTLEYFFRNMARINEEDENSQNTARRFKQLQTVLQKNLKNIQVYRIGSVQVDAFIIGELPDGNYAGLQTRLIET